MTNYSTIETVNPEPELDNMLSKELVNNRNGNPYKWTLKASKKPESEKKIILLINEKPATIQLINKCLTDNNTESNYEIINATNAKIAYEISESVKPDLIISDWKIGEVSGLELVKRMKSNPVTKEIPVLVFSGVRASFKEIGLVLSAGAIDCMKKNIEEKELKVRIAAILRQTDLLKAFKKREEKIRKEREQLSENLEKLQMLVDTEQRESTTRLELLIHSMGVKDKLLDRIHDLRPYLNAEGKTKLTYIAKQLKWELSEEKQFNLEQRFDEKNYELYNLLDKECSELTKNEKRLCAYFNADHSATEIARITHKSSNSINVAFARIRTKLNIATNKELKVYLANLLKDSNVVELEQEGKDAHLQQVG